MAINCAIIGCGQIAGGYDSPEEPNLVRTHAKAFLKSDKTNLLAVCDQNFETAKEFAKKWRAQKVYSETEQMLKENEFQILSISSPTTTHYSLLKKALEKEIPHIWLEKPACESIEDLKELIKLTENSTSKVYLNYFRRYDEGFQKVKSILDKEKILSFNAYYTKGLRHNGSHLINLLSWLLGAFQEATLSKIVSTNEYPTVSSRLSFDKADVNVNGFDHQLFEIFELDIVLERQRIRVLDGGQQIDFFEVENSSYYSGYKNFQLKHTHSGTYGQFMKNGLLAILEGSVHSTLSDELNTIEIISEIEQQAGLSNEK
jgi:predicted dehydrogenase